MLLTAGGRIHECLQPFSTLVKVGLVALVAVERYQRGLQQSILYGVGYTMALLVAVQIPQMLLPHLLKKPEHPVYFPAYGLYWYFRGFISIYTLFTLHQVCFSFAPIDQLRYANAKFRLVGVPGRI